MGVNFQYVEDSIDCMICNDEYASNTCSSGPRVLSWSEIVMMDRYLDESQGLCEAFDGDSDIELMDATLRDFVIVDRNGNEFARVNLTYNNPDPTEIGECTGNYQKIKDLILSARNR